MKNQYFGDINDYRKYGLLRALQADGDLSLCVAWMLTSNDGGSDGALRGYLREPRRWQHFDTQLYDLLDSVLAAGEPPRVAMLERCTTLSRASFFSQLVPDNRREREAWGEHLVAVAAGADLVFLDPDNGFEVASKPVGRKDSSKYVMWSEIEQLWAGGSSLLVYQHFRRERRDRFTVRIASELQSRTGASYVEAFRTPHVLFLLAAQPRQQSLLQHAIACRLPSWSGQVDVVGWSAG